MSCLLSLVLGDDEILFSFLKVLGELVTKVLTLLINTSLKLEYLLPFLKKARTVVLRKLGKASYKTVSA